MPITDGNVDKNLEKYIYTTKDQQLVKLITKLSNILPISDQL